MKRLIFSQYGRISVVIGIFVFVIFSFVGVEKSLGAGSQIWQQTEQDSHFHQGQYKFLMDSNADLGSFIFKLRRTETATTSCHMVLHFYSDSADRVVSDPVEYNSLILDTQQNVAFYNNSSTTSAFYGNSFVSGNYYQVYITSYRNTYGYNYNGESGVDCASYLVRDNLERFYKNGGDVSDFGLFIYDGTGGDVGNLSTSDLYGAFYANVYPVIGLLHPAPNLDYGNPVKFSGGISNVVDWDIYTGNELDTMDTLQLSGFSANNLNDDFMIDHAFYLPVGLNYVYVVAENEFGNVSTTSYSFYVDNSLSSWGTSTVPANPRTDSDLVDYASSTVVGFIDGLGDISACNFDWFSVFDISSWGNCAINLYHYTIGYVGEYIFNLFDRVASKWPWGYGYRVLRIITDSTGETAVPDLEFTMPADMGLPSSAVGKSFEFNPVESYATAKATIIASNEGTWDTVLYWWNYFCYLTFAFYLVHKLKTFSL